MRIDPLQLAPTGTRIFTENTGRVENGDKTFSQFMTEAMNDVNKLQNDASKASTDLATGKIQDLSEVTIATEKASIALQLTMQVRNKVVDAYQEIMRMQV